MFLYLCYGENGILTKASNARIEHLKSEMKQSLKIKLSEILTNNVGEINLSLLDGLFIDGYDTNVSNTGKLITLTKSSTKGIYFVDENFNVSELSSGESTLTSVVSDASYAALKKVSSTTTSVKVALNIPTTNISLVNYYLDGKLIYSGPEIEYTYINLDKTKTYTMYATVEYLAIPQVVAKPTVLEGDQAIFINAATGSDISGDGTENKPYETLDKIADVGIIQNGKIYAISLSDGDYTVSTKIFNLTNDKTINIYGNKENTKLIVGTLYGNNSSGGSTTYKMTFNRLTWQSSSAMYYNPVDIKTEMTFKNIVFNITETHGYSYFSACANIYMYNCISLDANMILRKNAYQIKLTNCYGNFTTGYSTSISDWNYQTNYITTSPNLSSIYEILDSTNIWKNIGTGNNSDGTKANLGVYGGEYTWSD